MHCNYLLFPYVVFFVKLYLKSAQIHQDLREDVYKSAVPFVFVVLLQVELLIRKH